MSRTIILLLLLFFSFSVQAGKRIALVIGNDTYQSVPVLKNARADARAVAQALKAAGFEVTLETNLNERVFRAALRDLRTKIQGGDDVLFYYAGHGVQISGAGDVSEYNWNQARDVRSRFAGHADWRLPMIDELKGLVYCSSEQPKTWNNSGNICEGGYEKPTIQAEAFPNTPSSNFWSGSPYADYSYYAWYVYFYSGDADYSYRSDGLQVRLVRGGQ
jgi:hypothetical protein